MPARKTAPSRKPARTVARPKAGARPLPMAVVGAGRALRLCGRIIAARPLLFGSVAVFGALAGVVGDNAVNRQGAPHPHPMLVTRPGEAPVARRTASVVPSAVAAVPEPRIENDPRIIAFPLVSEVQTLLTKRGYYKLPVDGRAGQATDLAIRAFQADRGLLVDGRATPLLLTQLRQEPRTAGQAGADALAGLIANTDPSGTGSISAGNENDLVRRIQAGLARARVAELQADGILGEHTRAAIRTFEALQGLEPTGEPSRDILRRLETAGAQG